MYSHKIFINTPQDIRKYSLYVINLVILNIFNKGNELGALHNLHTCMTYELINPRVKNLFDR